LPTSTPERSDIERVFDQQKNHSIIDVGVSTDNDNLCTTVEERRTRTKD